ncbi:hypothetical protein [Spirochaeta isovalerica]|uniref:Uncharacterized protein n=1 Tax=Spirochaeta isovalerica TaxID=150 RepID=A0A841RDG7_9SPIO|nr:hypothetical protein [Spirochaeta isovalerica]MBB6482085.1 hypothetical protein [Spirochaeta isovalerica]
MEQNIRTGKKVSWKELSRMFPPTKDETERARTLFISFEKEGYLRGEDLSPRKNSKAVIIDFYNRLALMRSPESPVRRKKKADWMNERDYARFNHHDYADTESYPLFLQLSLIPSIRAGALILAPFTTNRKGELNTVDSHSRICELYSEKDLMERGFSPEDQFHLFIDAIHLLGKCVGYTLDYRMDRFAVAVMRRPELFRWIDRNSGIPYREMLTEENQQKITGKVNSLVNGFLRELNGSPADEDYDRLRSLLKDSGFWTVPSCLNGSAQLPFLHPEHIGPVPHFSGGVENLTSFKFHLSVHSDESLRPAGKHNDVAVNYYGSLYIKWRDSFSFDLIKFSGIDYIDDEQKRSADSPDLDIVSKVISKTRGAISHTGVIGSVSTGNDNLAAAGFNVLFREAGDESPDRTYMDDFFRSSRYHSGLATALPVRFGTVDSLRRLFLSRFSGTGKNRIPKYEINGQDSALYHRIENVYTRYRDVMKKGELEGFFVEDQVAWWIVKSGSNILIPVISLDNLQEAVPEKINIDYSAVNHSSRILSVLEYDFNSSRGDLFLCGDDSILCENLPYRGFRLYSIQ